MSTKKVLSGGATAFPQLSPRPIYPSLWAFPNGIAWPVREIALFFARSWMIVQKDRTATEKNPSWAGVAKDAVRAALIM